MSLKKNLTFLAPLLLYTLLLESCGQYFSFGSSSSAPTDSGNPYDGKIYAILGGNCSDGTEIQSRIVTSSATQAVRDRENCQNITPVSLTAVDFQIDTTTDTLTYNSQNYTYIGYGLIGIANLSATNDVNDFFYSFTYESQPSYLQIFLDSDNDPNTGFAIYGIGVDYMIENDNVWIYTGGGPPPHTTWSWASHVSGNKNIISQNVSWSFPKTSVGSPTLIKFVARTSLGANSGVVTQTPQ